MIELLPISIGVGLVASLLFSELFGLAAGGMVVPGYIALYLNKPIDVVLTVAVAIATFAIVRALSSVMIVYGRRRTVLMILIAYLIGFLFRTLLHHPSMLVPHESYTIIGYIIPGLIAIWIDRQGMVETLATLVSASVVVRLVLILVVGTEILG